MAYAKENNIENRIGFPIDGDSRPSTTQLAGMLVDADSIINSFMKQSTNITDEFGLLRVIAIRLTMDMINNLLAYAEPENYAQIVVALTEEDKDDIRQAHSVWQSYSWEMGID